MPVSSGGGQWAENPSPKTSPKAEWEASRALHGAASPRERSLDGVCGASYRATLAGEGVISGDPKCHVVRQRRYRTELTIMVLVTAGVRSSEGDD